MRQVVISRYGGPEVLTLKECQDPKPGEGEVAIRMKASGINFSDILARRGLYPDAPKPPCVVGYAAVTGGRAIVRSGPQGA
jgi:NADPH:quinone reductase-like Zn-dependent oxidoreductase